MKKLLVLIFLYLSFNSNRLLAQNWESLSDIPEKLTFPVAAVVDGKIHLMGGGGTGGATTKHFEYDPSINKWTEKAAVPYKAQQPAGAANDGKIHYFGGGFPNSGTPLKSHFIYDPTTNTWSAAADLSPARAIHYAASLNNQLYSMAGQGVSSRLEVFDPKTNSWTIKNDLPDSKFWYGIHVATHGSIFRFCGGGYTAPVSFAHQYDPGKDSWIALPNTPVAIHGLGGEAIGDKIYLVGGYHDFEDSKEVWIYDIPTQKYLPGIPLPAGRSYHKVVVLDNCLYSLGGNNAIDPTVGSSLLKFCPNISSSVNDQSSNDISVRYDGETLHISLNPSSKGIFEIRITNLAGQLLQEDFINANGGQMIQIPVQDLPAAIYSLQIISEGRSFNQTIFISK